jgi:hypothetical protein
LAIFDNDKLISLAFADLGKRKDSQDSGGVNSKSDSCSFLALDLLFFFGIKIKSDLKKKKLIE